MIRLLFIKLGLIAVMLFSVGQAFAQRPVDMFAVGGSIGGYSLNPGRRAVFDRGFRQSQTIYVQESFGSVTLSARILSGKGRISCSSKSCNLTGVPSGVGPTVKIRIIVTNTGSRDASGGVWHR